jgi:hypothetical protein
VRDTGFEEYLTTMRDGMRKSIHADILAFVSDEHKMKQLQDELDQYKADYKRYGSAAKLWVSDFRSLSTIMNASVNEYFIFENENEAGLKAVYIDYVNLESDARKADRKLFEEEIDYSSAEVFKKQERPREILAKKTRLLAVIEG